MQLRLLLACKDSHSGNSSPAFAAEAGFIDFEGLLFGSLADCVVGGSKENGSSSTGFEIA
jgi:hypothetical protein